MNNDQDYHQPNSYQPPAAPSSPPPIQPAAQPTWPPQQPVSTTPPSTPAVDLARQQLADAFKHEVAANPEPVASPNTQPANYNPYRQMPTTYNMPAAATAEPAVPAPVQSPPPAPVNYSAPYQQPAPVHGQVEAPERSVADIKQQLLKSVHGANQRPASRWKPMLIALVVGLVFLSINYNEVALAQIRQYVSPSSSLSTPVIIDPSSQVEISNEPRLIIPKINVDVPVVYDEKTYDEARIQQALEHGVVHYGDTALPGQIGNNVIVGHSSNNFFNGGKYKFAFVLLDRLEKDDTFILHYKGERYIYKVYNKQIIEPTDFSLIQPTNKPVVTLITCTPPGTAWHRLVVQAEQISPSTANAKPANTHIPDDIDSPVPGNAPSLWSRFWDSF